MPPPRTSPFRTVTDWSGDPWATPEEREAWDKARRTKWIASLSERDWERLTAATAEVHGATPSCPVDDLDAPIRVVVIRADAARHFGGAPFGKLKGCVLKAWPK